MSPIRNHVLDTAIREPPAETALAPSTPIIWEAKAMPTAIQLSMTYAADYGTTVSSYLLLKSR